MGGVATLVMSLSTYDSLVVTRDRFYAEYRFCLLYTSDAADERSSVDLGGRRIIKKKNNKNIEQVGGVLIRSVT